MATPERRIFSCTATVTRMILNIKRGYSLLCWKNKLKFLALMIVHLMFRNQKKALGE
jgi:hypothetical protein